MRDITQERLKEVLSYNEGTGEFVWRKWSSGKRRDMKAGVLNKRGYIYIGIDGQRPQAHRLAWLYVHGEFPKNVIDHIDGNGSNNAISNLRDVTRSENQRNLKTRCESKSGFTGVSWCSARKKWAVRITNNGKYIMLGRYGDLDKAIEVRKSANIKYGYHENHGRAA